jgi:hypothetical protein
MNNNTFMKIVLTALLNDKQIDNKDITKLMLDYTWEIEQDGPHDYYVIGNHPVARRIGIILKDTVIH